MGSLLQSWGHTHFHTLGHGPAVVFANSLGTDLRMWQGVHLPGHQVVGYDKRGHGLSARSTQPFDLRDLADDMAALMDHLGLARAVIAGCSVGGLIAMAMAVYHPSRVVGLVVSNSAAQIGTAQGWQDRIDAIAAHGMGPMVPAILTRWFADDFRTSPDALPWATMLERCDPQGYVDICKVLALADLRDRVAGLTLPALFLAGGQDQATPPALVQETAARIRGARMVVLEGSGHIPAIDNPTQTTTLIAEFLKETGHV